MDYKYDHAVKKNTRLLFKSFAFLPIQGGSG